MAGICFVLANVFEDRRDGGKKGHFVAANGYFLEFMFFKFVRVYAHKDIEQLGARASLISAF